MDAPCPIPDPSALSTGSLMLRKTLMLPARADLVSRPRLLQILDDGGGAGLTTVCAPAGAGKSTLLSQWLAQASGNVAWLSLGPEDNEPARFWTYVIAAIQRVAPGFGRSAASRSGDALTIDAVTTLMANELNAVTEELTLALDNFQVITAAATQTSLAAVIDHLPPNIRIVIASRTEPNLSLSRLRSTGRLIEIRGADLGFSLAESRGFLNGTMHLGLPLREVDALHGRMEGWPAGLRLAAIAARDAADGVQAAASFGGGHPFVLDYFADEVLRGLPEDVYAFLVCTSIAQNLCASLCEAITEQGHGQAMLRRVRRQNLFLVPLDDHARWYRYHHCFAETLSRRLEDKGPELVKTLHQRALHWYLQRGLMREAVDHALAAGECDIGADLIEHQVDELIWERGEIARLLGWLAALPLDVVRAHPRLSLARAWALALTGQLGSIEEQLAIVEQGLRLPGGSVRQTGRARAELTTRQSTLAEVAAVRAITAGLQIDTARLASWSTEAVSYAPENRFLLSVLALSRARAHDIAADVRNAVAAYAEARDLSEGIANTHILAVATSRLAELWALQGDLHQAADTHRRVLRLVDEESNPRSAVGAMSHIGLGSLLYEWNDLVEAARHFEEGMAQAAAWGHLETLKGAYFGLARLRFAQGLTEEAVELLSEAEALARHSDAPRSVAWVHAMQARMSLAHGDVSAARHWAQTSPLRPEREAMRLFTGEHTTLARLMTARGEYDEALALLERLLQIATDERWRGLVIEILVLKALGFHIRGALRAAFSPLRKALSLAAPEGYVRTFLDEGGPLEELLVRASSYPAMPAYLEVVLAAFKSGAGDRAVRAAGGPPVLTPREREVLQHIAAGETNQEIAQQLVLAVATVKRHVSNIFDKFGVSSRTQAVARARQRGLL
jgi:LuxR family maltose regulon positive regulatory protein